jgi:hypothetical protein
MIKHILRLLSVALLLLGVGWWLLTGANRGWTKTSVPVKTLDEVTGIEGITYHQRFVPGVDFLGVSVVISATLAGVSWLFRNKRGQHPKELFLSEPIKTKQTNHTSAV